MTETWNNLTYFCSTAMCFGVDATAFTSPTAPDRSQKPQSDRCTGEDSYSCSSPTWQPSMAVLKKEVSTNSTVPSTVVTQAATQDSSFAIPSPSEMGFGSDEAYDDKSAHNDLPESPREHAPVSPTCSDEKMDNNELPPYFRYNPWQKDDLDDDSAHFYLKPHWEIKKANPVKIPKPWAVEEEKCDDSTISTQSSYSISDNMMKDEQTTFKLLWGHAVAESTLDGFVLTSPISSSDGENIDPYHTPPPVRTNAMGEIVIAGPDRCSENDVPYLPNLENA